MVGCAGLEQVVDEDEIVEQEMVSGIAYTPEDVQAGTGLYVENCAGCHGAPGLNNGGNVPNLGYAHRELLEQLPHVVLDGIFLGSGMPRCAGRLNEEQVLQIRAFILSSADAARRQ